MTSNNHGVSAPAFTGWGRRALYPMQTPHSGVPHADAIIPTYQNLTSTPG